MECRTCPPLKKVLYNGMFITPDQIPEAWVREMHGLGHINPYNRSVVPGEWPHGVYTCRFEEHGARWQDKDGNWLTFEQIAAGADGVTLVCTGCGLDCT